MFTITVEIHHHSAEAASGIAQRLGFELEWRASATGPAWTVWIHTDPSTSRNPATFDLIVDGNWTAFEARVVEAIRARQPEPAPTG